MDLRSCSRASETTRPSLRTEPRTRRRRPQRRVPRSHGEARPPRQCWPPFPAKQLSRGSGRSYLSPPHKPISLRPNSAAAARPKRPSPSARPPACPPGAGPGAQSLRARQGHLPTTHVSTTPPRLRAHGSSVGRPPEPHCCYDSCHRRVTWNGVNTLHSSPGVGNPGRDSRTKIEVSGRGDRVHPGGPRRSPGPAFSLLPLHATRTPQPETSELRP